MFVLFMRNCVKLKGIWQIENQYILKIILLSFKYID